MASTPEYVQFVCEQVAPAGEIRTRKMFGEYMVYVNDKPLLLVCDNTVYIRIHDAISPFMADAQRGLPYVGAKEHYVLDIENAQHAVNVITTLEPLVPIPTPRKKKAK